MDTVPPSYQSATTRDALSIIAQYIPSSDLCAAALVCRRWHQTFMPFLWGDPASHFGTDNDAVYVALTRFRRTLKYARLEVRILTHTLHLPPALTEIYGGPRPEWLREILDYLPCLQSLMVSKLPFFDHNAMMAMKSTVKDAVSYTYNIRLLLAEREPNSTSQGLAEALLHFPDLVYLDLSYTTSARDSMVISSLSQLQQLQVLKLRGIGLKDNDAEFLANAIGQRVRVLDIRNNLLTDMAVRSLLQACFKNRGMPGADRGSEPWMSGSFNSPSQLMASLSSSKLLSSSTLDEKFMKALTQPLTGRSWVEDLSSVGITHLYIAENQITVEGVASLLASSRLHVLDVGTVDTANSLIRGQLPLSSQPRENPQELPGAEKLVPVLGTAARDNLTYLRAHHAICTVDAPNRDSGPENTFLAELPTGLEGMPQEQELSSSSAVHEMPGEGVTIFELEGSPALPPSGPPGGTADKQLHSPVYKDEPLPAVRRGSVFAPEVVEPEAVADDDHVTTLGTNGITASPTQIPHELSMSTFSNLEICSDSTRPVPRSTSPLPTEDFRGQKIQDLLSKRPRNYRLPRQHKELAFPYLHPSHIPHLETLVLTDVPSHVPADSPLLKSLIRFITACSNEALLATLQAGSDYSLPPGRDRAKVEQERSRSLFALRRLVLEINPKAKEKSHMSRTSWSQNGATRLSTGDRDIDNMWTASEGDFSFFDNEECGIPGNDTGKYFPMAALNEKVVFMPEEDDSGSPGGSSPAISSSPSLHPPNRHSLLRKHPRPDSIGRGTFSGVSPTDGGAMYPPPAQMPELDLVAELAAFRRGKKIQYEELVRRERNRRSTVGSASLLSPSVSSMRSPSPSLSVSSFSGVPAPVSLAHFVEGHWKGEVKIVRNAAPKGRSGMVDMYGNYFEKGYLYP